MKNIKLVLTLLIIILSIVVLFKKPLILGLDLQGGMSVVLEAKDTDDRKVDGDAILGVMDVIRNRLNSTGTSEVSIRSKGSRQIVVELPGVTDPERALKLIGETAQLEFVEAEWAPPGIENLPQADQDTLIGNGKIGYLEGKTPEGRIVRTPIILKQTVLTGKDLKTANPGTSQYGDPVVNIEFNSEGAQKFQTVTTQHAGKPLAIILDGKIISAPNINEPITGGKAQISGHFSIAEMRDLVVKLKAGALPVPVEIISNKIVGPTLGQDSIKKSQIACVIGFVIVCLYMIGFYKIPGLISGIALLIYTLVSYATLKLIGATLTLQGMAGFILTIGIAVDANVIIFERIKEEKKRGIPMNMAISIGFQSAFKTIVDANVTTLIGAAALFILGTGSIKGFAVTLTIGILVSMFTAITLTRLLLDAVTELTNKQLVVKK